MVKHKQFNPGRLHVKMKKKFKKCCVWDKGPDLLPGWNSSLYIGSCPKPLQIPSFKSLHKIHQRPAFMFSLCTFLWENCGGLQLASVAAEQWHFLNVPPPAPPAPRPCSPQTLSVKCNKSSSFFCPRTDCAGEPYWESCFQHTEN